MDTFSKSDPFAILFLQRGNVWQRIGQTEVIHDNLNPRWVQKITVDYHFEQQERFKVQVFDSDDDKNLQSLPSHDFIGEIEFQLHEIVTTRDQSLTKPLFNAQRAKPGIIHITAEELAATANTEHVMFMPEATGLKDMSGQLFFIIYKNLGPGQFTPVYKSETKSAIGGLCKWNLVQIGTTDLCKDELERQVSIEFFRFNSSGKHKIVGTCNTVTLAQIKTGKQDYPVTKTGSFKFGQCKVERVHSFLEYVFAGC